MAIKLWAVLKLKWSIVIELPAGGQVFGPHCTQPPITAYLWYHPHIQENGADQTNFQASQPLNDWLIVFISKIDKKVNKTKQLT